MEKGKKKRKSWACWFDLVFCNEEICVFISEMIIFTGERGRQMQKRGWNSLLREMN